MDAFFGFVVKPSPSLAILRVPTQPPSKNSGSRAVQPAGSCKLLAVFLETLNCMLRCYVDALACLRRSSCSCFTTWKRRWGDEACPAHRAGMWCESLLTAQACPTDALIPSPRGPRRVLLQSWRAQWLSAWTYIFVLKLRNKRQVPCWWHRCSARRAPRHAKLIRRARHQHERHDQVGSE